MIITGYTGNERTLRLPATIRGLPVREIGESSFGGDLIPPDGYPGPASTIISIVIPEGVTTINAAAFAGCRYIDSVTLPSTISVIYGSAFFFCVELKTVIIPESVKRIIFSKYCL